MSHSLLHSSRCQTQQMKHLQRGGKRWRQTVHGCCWRLCGPPTCWTCAQRCRVCAGLCCMILVLAVVYAAAVHVL